MSYLGIDVGGTALKLGLVTAEGKILSRAEHSVNFDGYRTPIIETLLRRSSTFVAALPEKPEGVGISAAGQIRVHDGMVAGTCGNWPDWENVPIRALVEEALALPATVMNDANCAVLGEQWVGRAQGFAQVAMVTLGTGVGGGVLADGKVLIGKDGFAGELGHMPLHAGGMPCTCGLFGCYEQYASVTALLRLAAEVYPEEPMNGRRLFEKAQQGEQKAKDALAQWIEEIAAGLVGLVHLFNPELLLIGGGVSAQQEYLLQPLREKVFSSVMPRYREELRMEAAALGNDAGMIGAVRFFLDSRA